METMSEVKVEDYHYLPSTSDYSLATLHCLSSILACPASTSQNCAPPFNVQFDSETILLEAWLAIAI